MKRSEKPEVYSITGARSGLSDDVSGRTKRYLISMAIRTVCVVGAVVAHGPLRWILVAGAVLLPYVAVVIANTARRSTGGPGPAPIAPASAPSLESREQHPPTG